jgi:hypothetical protein
MRHGRAFITAVIACLLLPAASAAAAAPAPPPVQEKLDLRFRTGAGAPATSTRRPDAVGAARLGRNGLVQHNFKVLGRHALRGPDTNADVWVHGDFAYVGTWQDPCTGRGVKIVDASDVERPRLIGTLAARRGTSAEDMVVRRVSTPFFSGDLLGVGIQRCGSGAALDSQRFGLELWDVSDPAAPVRLGGFPVARGLGGVRELDLFQRNGRVFALLAYPFSEWFDPATRGDFTIVEVTNPRRPVLLAEWGAGENGFSRGPFWGQGSLGTMFGHSARASADGTKAYVSYWDLGVLTFDIRDPASPKLVARTKFEPWDDGDAHSMTPYTAGNGRTFILQNDEDFEPTTPAIIRYGPTGLGVGAEGPGGVPLWLVLGHRVEAGVVRARRQGCRPSNYPARTAGSIAVVGTPIPFFDPPGTTPEPRCDMAEQEAAAEAAGARAVVHDVVSLNTSPQWFDVGDVDIPVLFTDRETAAGMVEAGRAVLRARRASWGYLRVYDAKTGEQVGQWFNARNVRRLPAPRGSWTIHNTEVLGKRSYSSWYSNGIVALDLTPLDRARPGNPLKVGQFVPPTIDGVVPNMWGVAIREDGIIFASDERSGLWIVKPIRRAAP